MADHLDKVENLVVTRTFSKACGLAGMRLGYVVGNKKIVYSIRKLQPMDHINSFACKFGEYVIDNDYLIWDYVKEVDKGREYLETELPKLGFRPVPSHGNFMLIEVGDKMDAVVASCEKSGVLIGKNLRLPFPHSYIRFAVGPVTEMKRALEALKVAI